MLDLADSNASNLEKVLETYLIDYSVDPDDGDIIVDDIAKFFLRKNFEKKLIEFYTNIKISNKKEMSQLEAYEFVTKLNVISDTLKYSLIKKNAIHCSYSIPMDGSIDEVFFAKLVKLIIKSLATAELLMQDPQGFLSEMKEME